VRAVGGSFGWTPAISVSILTSPEVVHWSYRSNGLGRGAIIAVVDTAHRPAVAAVIGFIDRINHGDADGLAALMTDDHELRVFTEPPISGRSANVDAWRGYASAYPRYCIHPHRIAERGERVAVQGHTTGSHLDLPEAEERRTTLIWVADVCDGALRAWTLVDDTPDNRSALGLADLL
jgi:ketosteroid isomerase-like protein